MRLRLAQAFFVVVVLLAAGLTAAGAHPHVWVTAKADILYGPDGGATGVRHSWAFDDAFSVYATEGIETKVKGIYTREDLAGVAQTNMESLKDYGYFTIVQTGLKPGAGTAEKKKAPKVALGDPKDYWLEFKDSILTLHFTLPFKQPVKAQNLSVDIYDPEFFVDIAMADNDPVHLVGAPAACKMTLHRAGQPTSSQQQLSESFFTQMAGQDWGAQFANTIAVACP